ncbi:hypothetical protein GCM10025857_16070 [Alicyclobacillus contaminans]|nr:hypothetical protein GCM10025857_16070 [Alicyclobacillus contaminans]
MGSSMATRFRPRKRRLPGTAWLFVGAGLAGALALFELYQMVIPFQSANPLWREVTVGEPVIDSWRYGGLDEEGYLRFYNNGQTALLPPSAHTFDADGQFVVLEGHTASSLTFASPYEAIPARWLISGAAVLCLGGMVLWLRRRARGPRLRLKRSQSVRIRPTWRSQKPRDWRGQRGFAEAIAFRKKRFRANRSSKG